ncbi:hypothetical protein CEP53_005084 [Fusarium sp. AF-6]|nr:hypothetical protein CEP53_005084 [Fusarium sp. AF-6]
MRELPLTVFLTTLVLGWSISRPHLIHAQIVRSKEYFFWPNQRYPVGEEKHILPSQQYPVAMRDTSELPIRSVLHWPSTQGLDTGPIERFFCPSSSNTRLMFAISQHASGADETTHMAFLLADNHYCRLVVAIHAEDFRASLS